MSMQGSPPSRQWLAKRDYRTMEGQWRVILNFIRDPNFLVVCALATVGLIGSFGLQLFFPLPHETWTSFANFA